MGKQLTDYYEKAKQMGGLKAQMRLAILTNIPSSKAQLEADSPDNLKKFETAIAELKKEFK